MAKIILYWLMGKKTYTFKAGNKNLGFRTQFLSEKFDVTESIEISLKVNVYDFSVDPKSINKSDILNIHKY